MNFRPVFLWQKQALRRGRGDRISEKRKRSGSVQRVATFDEVFKSADYIIDLGPEGGYKGGTIVATGTPEEVSQVEESYTGQFLKKVL